MVLSIFIQKKYVFASVMSSSGCSHFGLLFTNEEQKKAGSHAVDTFAVHASPGYDMNDTDCW